MRYLITSLMFEPFLTKWYDYENSYNPDIGMVVYDLAEEKYTNDGINWKEITIDHL